MDVAHALLTGALAVTACAYLAAVYLTHDAHRRHQHGLVRYFGVRAAIAGGASGLRAAAALAAMRSEGPFVFHGLVGRVLPLLAGSVTAGTGALALIIMRRLRGLRVLAAAAITCAVWAWGVARYPWLLPTSLSLESGSAPTGTMLAELVTVALVLLLVTPGFGLLFWLQHHDLLGENSTHDLCHSAAAAQPTGHRSGSDR